MIRRPPRSTRTDTLFPDTTLFRSRSMIDQHLPLPARAPSAVTAVDLQMLVRWLWASVRPALILLVSERIPPRSEEHTSELQSLMRISYAVFCLKKKRYLQYY